jgi:TetR/AcrR family transcriptional repressor of nem operon
MPKSPAQKLVSREKILRTAAGLLRSDGPEGASVQKVMAAAGFTVGGFYAHFASKDELVTQAFQEGVRQRREYLRPILADTHGLERLATFLVNYLTEEHVAEIAGGCAWAALLSDLPRLDPATRVLATGFFQDTIAAFGGSADQPAGKPSESDRPIVIASLAMAFGTLNLARMVDNPTLSQEILRAGLQAGTALIASIKKGI